MKKEAMEVLLNRRAIRKFKNDPIPAEILDAVLEAGTFAPTGSGRQSPVILAVQDEEKVNKIKKRTAVAVRFFVQSWVTVPSPKTGMGSPKKVGAGL